MSLLLRWKTVMLGALYRWVQMKAGLAEALAILVDLFAWLVPGILASFAFGRWMHAWGIIWR